MGTASCLSARRAAIATRCYPTLAAMKLRRRWGTRIGGSISSEFSDRDGFFVLAEDRA
jgi:hypothetical protein